MTVTVKLVAVLVLIAVLLVPLSDAHKGKKHQKGKYHPGKSHGKEERKGKHSDSSETNNSGEHEDPHGTGHRKGGNQSEDTSHISCKFEALNRTYDFSRFTERSFKASSGSDEISFSFCRILAEFEATPLECPKEAGACRKYNGKFENAGQMEDIDQPKWNLFENGVIMSFVHGDSCLRNSENSTKSTHVQMTCDHHAKFEVDSVEMNDCETIVKARTRRACPVDTLRGSRHHRMRKPIILIVIIVLTTFFACLTGLCGLCCLIRRQQRARISTEMGHVIQPQIVAAPMGIFNPEMMHAMYPNIEMYPMQNQVVPSAASIESDEEMAKRLQAEFNRL